MMTFRTKMRQPSFSACATVAMVIAAIHYLSWSSSGINPLSGRAPFLETVVHENRRELDSSTMPEQVTSVGGLSEKGTERANEVNFHLEKTAEKTCQSEKYAFDSNNKACLDLTWTTNDQVIFASDAQNVTYLYCGIPKNGCTYHLGLMYRIAGDPEYNEGGAAVHSVLKKVPYRLSQKEPERIKHFLTNPSVPKYMVVRNPMIRTLSAYRDKVEPLLPEEKRTTESFGDWVYNEFKSPEEMRDIRVNPHWRPQTRFCGFNLRDVSTYFTVFRAEHPEEYVDFVYKIVPSRYLDDGWGSKNLSFRASVLGPRERTGNTEVEFDNYFKDIAMFDYLANSLREDIARLNYSADVKEQRDKILALQTKGR